MLMCDRCGKKKDESELKTVVEPHGEMHLDKTCDCGGEYLFARKCKDCGEYFLDELSLELCHKCINSHCTVENALVLGENYKTSIDGINGAIGYLLSTDQINKILTKWVEENFTDCSLPIQDYCKDDLSFFVDYIIERENL